MTRRSADQPRPDERPVVLVYRSPLFNPSETFVQAHAAGLIRYRPLLIGLEDKGNAWPNLRDRILTPRSEEEALRFKLLGQAGIIASLLAGAITEAGPRPFRARRPARPAARAGPRRAAGHDPARL